MARPPIRERARPRISVNELALFMVSSDTARIGIIRRAKNPQAPPIIRYRDARPPICAYLADANRRVNPLVAAEEMLQQRAEDPIESSLRQDDARHSIEVLHAIQGMANRLGPFDFVPAPNNQGKLTLADVEISVRVDLLVHGSSRGGQNQIGAAVLRMTQDDADTESAKDKRREMGVCVATLARLHVDQNIPHDGREVANRLCMSIDVQHGELFQAPESNTRRMNDGQAAFPPCPLDGGKRGAECVDALCDHEVVRVDGGKLDGWRASRSATGSWPRPAASPGGRSGPRSGRERRARECRRTRDPRQGCQKR
jgi:hypothetical protein